MQLTLQISSCVKSQATSSLRVGMSTPYTLGYLTGGAALARYTCMCVTKAAERMHDCYSDERTCAVWLLVCVIRNS